MSQEEFGKKDLNEREKNYIRMRSLMDYGMGVIWMGVGFCMIFAKKLNLGIEENLGDGILISLGIVFILYAAFRIYRGYRKNYLRER